MSLRIDRNQPPAPRATEARPEQAPAAAPQSRPAETAFDHGCCGGAQQLTGQADRHVTLPTLELGGGGGLASETVRGAATPNAAIKDNAKVESTIKIDRDLDIGKLSVNLDIGHTYRGDLKVTLTSPSGKTAVLHDRTGGSADNLTGRFDPQVFAGEPSVGEWKLTVEDKARGDVGTLKAWDLEITGTPRNPPPPPTEGEPIKKTSAPNLPILDNKTVKSEIEVTEDVTVDKLQLDLGIKHTYQGDLVVKLTSPSGKTVTVHDRKGGGTDDLRGSFDLAAAFAGEKTAGKWTLEVSDTAAQDTGTLETWGLTITPKDGNPPPPPPPGDDKDPMTHIKILASDEMRGRDSPGPDFDRASAYVKDYMVKYGLKGPNAADPQNPYYQTFDMLTFDPDASAREQETPHSLDPKDFSEPLFGKGHYIDKTLSEEDVQVLNQRYADAMRARGETPQRGSGPNGALSADELLAVSQRASTQQNVMGLIEGTGPNKDEVIVVMAHLDHVGVDRNGNPYNGADDNASGSATLMAAIPELMELKARGELNRSVLVLWTAAEEDGLVGAKYFADHPIPGLGLKEITGVVNMDMVGRWDDQRLSIMDTTGNSPNYFRDVVEQANQQLADPFDRLNRDINSFRDRQDGAIFSRKGEDVLMLFEGLSNPNGGGSLIPEYHGTGDDVDKIIRDNGGNKPRRVKDLFVNILKLASNRVATPAAEQNASVVWR